MSPVCSQPSGVKIVRGFPGHRYNSRSNILACHLDIAHGIFGQQAVMFVANPYPAILHG